MLFMLLVALLPMLLRSLGARTAHNDIGLREQPKTRYCNFTFIQEQQCRSHNSLIKMQRFSVSNLTRWVLAENSEDRVRDTGVSNAPGFTPIPWGIGSFQLGYFGDDHRDFSLHYAQESIYFSLGLQGWIVGGIIDSNKALIGDCKWKDWVAGSSWKNQDISATPTELVTPGIQVALLNETMEDTLDNDLTGFCDLPQEGAQPVLCNSTDGAVEQHSLKCGLGYMARPRVRVY